MKTQFEWKKEGDFGECDGILELSTNHGEFRLISFDNEARLLIRWYNDLEHPECFREIFIHYFNPKTKFIPMLQEFIALTEEKFGKDWSERGG